MSTEADAAAGILDLLGIGGGAGGGVAGTLIYQRLFGSNKNIVDRVDRALSQIEATLSAIDQRMVEVEEKATRIVQSNHELTAEIREMVRAIQQTNQSFARLEGFFMSQHTTHP